MKDFVGIVLHSPLQGIKVDFLSLSLDLPYGAGGNLISNVYEKFSPKKPGGLICEVGQVFP